MNFHTPPLDPDKMAKLRAQNPKQLKKEAEKRRAEQEEWERRYKEYSKLVKRMDKLVSELQPLQKEMDELYREMDIEAGMKGDDWDDDDGNRYGEMMNKVFFKIEKKQKEIAKIQKILKSEFPDMT